MNIEYNQEYYTCITGVDMNSFRKPIELERGSEQIENWVAFVIWLLSVWIVAMVILVRNA